MAKKLELILGIPRMTNESSSVAIYDQTIEIVSSGAGAGQLNGPISAGTPVTLPSGQTYTSAELEVYLGGERLKSIFDYTYASSTSVSFTFQLLPLDILRFRIDRSA